MWRPNPLLPLAALLVAGCAKTPPPIKQLYQSPAPMPKVKAHLSPGLPARRLRALVLPFRSPNAEAIRTVTGGFAVELEKTQAFEGISPNGQGEAIARRFPVWQPGGLDIQMLVDLRRRHRIGALILGHVTHFRPYNPPVLGLRVQAVSTRTGSVLWAVEGCFDARDEGVRKLMRRYYRENLEGDGHQHGWTLLLESPRHYTQFVAHQLCATLGPPRKQPPLAWARDLVD